MGALVRHSADDYTVGRCRVPWRQFCCIRHPYEKPTEFMSVSQVSPESEGTKTNLFVIRYRHRFMARFRVRLVLLRVDLQ